MQITKIPTPLPSKLFRGTMPYEISTDPTILSDLKANKIKQIVLLCPTYEYEHVTCADLKGIYEANGIKVIHFPIIDQKVPEMEDLRRLIDNLYEDLFENDQNNTLVHCLGGKGRTGLIIACLARKIFKINHKEAINWVRAYVPGSVETQLQIKMVKDFIEEPVGSEADFLPIYEFIDWIRKCVPGPVGAPMDTPMVKDKMEEPSGSEAQPLPIQPLPSRSHSVSSSSSVRSLSTLPAQSLVELPLEMTSKIYKGLMPFEITTKPDILKDLAQLQIKKIVMLCTEQEYKFATFTDLKELYIQNDFEVIHFPIPDAGVPSKEGLEELLQNILKGLSEKDNNTLVHCLRGGRTGMIAACLARKVLRLNGQEAINWMQLFIPKGLSPKQCDMIADINL